MSDERERTLQRQVALGDPEAEVQLLTERLRAGRVNELRLRLLALLGDETARRVLGGDWPQPQREDAGELLARLRPSANRSLILEGVFGAAQLAVDVWERERKNDTRAREALEAARAWWAAIDAGCTGEELARLGDAALASSFKLQQAALYEPGRLGSAARAASEPAHTIEATGGRFLTSAQAITELLDHAGVPMARVCEAILGAIRSSMLR